MIPGWFRGLPDYVLCLAIHLAVVMAWLAGLALLPGCNDIIGNPSSCVSRRASFVQLMFWWPVWATLTLLWRAVAREDRRLRLTGDSVFEAWLRYLGAIAIGGVLFTTTALLLDYLDGKDWMAYLVYWGAATILFILSIPFAALLFFMARRRWRNSPELVEEKSRPPKDRRLARIQRRRHW